MKTNLDFDKLVYVYGRIHDPYRGSIPIKVALQGSEFCISLAQMSIYQLHLLSKHHKIDVSRVGINDDPMFVESDIWRWIEEYDAKDGYAGLTLVEYLRRLGYGTGMSGAIMGDGETTNG